MVAQPPQTPNHGKYGINVYGCYFRVDDDNEIGYKSMIKYDSKIDRALVRFYTKKGHTTTRPEYQYFLSCESDHLLTVMAGLNCKLNKTFTIYIALQMIYYVLWAQYGIAGL